MLLLRLESLIPEDHLQTIEKQKPEVKIQKKSAVKRRYSI